MKKVTREKLIMILMLIIAFVPLILGIKPMVVLSGSMEPAIKTGSLCFVNKSKDYESINEGDIITYKLLGEKITHRVVEKRDEGCLTKGDANDVKDLGIVNKSNYYGKMIFSIPFLGYLIIFLKEYRPYIFTLVFMLLLIYFITKSIRKRKERVYD